MPPSLIKNLNFYVELFAHTTVCARDTKEQFSIVCVIQYALKIYSPYQNAVLKFDTFLYLTRQKLSVLSCRKSCVSTFLRKCKTLQLFCSLFEKSGITKVKVHHVIVQEYLRFIHVTKVQLCKYRLRIGFLMATQNRGTPMTIYAGISINEGTYAVEIFMMMFLRDENRRSSKPL